MTNSTTSGSDPLTGISAAIGQTFAFIVLGYLMLAGGIVPRDAAKGIGALIGKLSLPALLFRGMARLSFGDLSYELLASMVLGKFLALLIASGFALCTSRSGDRLKKAGIYAIFSTQSNDFAFGVPLVSALLPEYLPYFFLIAPFQLAFLNPIGFVLLEAGLAKETADLAASKSDGVGKQQRPGYCKTSLKIFKGVVTNPVVFMTVLGLIWGQSFGSPSGFFDDLLVTAGNAFNVAALFSLGLSIYGKLGVLKGRALLQPMFLVLVKSLALPVFILLLLKAFSPGASERDATFGFIYGTLPVAPSAFIFATQYRAYPERVSGAMVLSIIVSAPLLYISTILVSQDASDGSLWRAVNNTEVTIGVLSAVLAGVVLLLSLFVKEGRRRPLDAVLHLIFCAVMFPIFNSFCLEDTMSNDPGSNTARFIFAVKECFKMGQRLWLIGLATILTTLASKGAPATAKLHRWLPVVIYSASALYAAVWALVGSVDEDSLVPCWYLYGKPQIGTDMLTAIVLVAVLLRVTLSIERQHHRYKRLPNNLTTLYDGGKAGSPTVVDKGERRWSLNPATPDAKGTPRSPSAVATDAGAGGDEVAMDDLSPRDSQRRLTSGLAASQDSVSSQLTDASEDSLAGTTGEFEVMSEPEGGGGGSISDKFRLQLLMLWSMLGFALVIAVNVAMLSGSDKTLREPAVLQTRFIGAAFEFAVGSVAAFLFGARAGVTRRLSSMWEMMQRTLRRALYDVDDVSLVVHNDEQAAVIESASIRQLLYEIRCAGLLKNRRYGLRTYKRCLVGQELVSHLVANNHAVDRGEAADIGDILEQCNLLCHVTLEHRFRDSGFFYTVEPPPNCPPELSRIATAVDQAQPPLFGSRRVGSKTYRKAASGAEITTWLVNAGHAASREEAVRMGRAMILHDILAHVTDSNGFTDEADVFFVVLSRRARAAARRSVHPSTVVTSPLYARVQGGPAPISVPAGADSRV